VSVTADQYGSSVSKPSTAYELSRSDQSRNDVVFAPS